MKRILDSHMNCIRDILNEISYKYRNKKHFFDIGCGDGTRTVLFDKFGRMVCGVDLLDGLKETIRGRINFRQEDLLDGLSYERVFDIILSFDVIEHLPNPMVMLKEVYRILKKDGIFIISTPNRNRLFQFFLLLFELRKFPYYVNKAQIDSVPYSAHVIEYTSSELECLLQQARFRVIKKYKLFYGIPGGYGFSSLFSFPLFHNILFECEKVEVKI